MDHIGVLKRAWMVTWRYRILWLFGLFAGGAATTGGGSGNYSFSQDDMPISQRDIDQIGRWLENNLGLLVIGAAIIFAIGLALMVISIAAKGGLVHLVNEAEEGRTVSGLDGWSAGFRMWFRVFGIGFVLFAPIALFSALLFIAVIAPIAVPLIRGGEPGVEALFAICGGTLVGGLILVVAAIVAGLLDTLGVRHAVLGGSGVFRSIGLAWEDIRTRFKDVAVMWLLMIAVGIAYGIAMSVVATVFGFAAVFAGLQGAWLLGGVIGFVMFLVLLVPAAIYGTFSSAVWTVFYRRLTGRELAQDTQAPPPPPAPSYAPPMAPPPPRAPGSPDAISAPPE